METTRATPAFWVRMIVYDYDDKRERIEGVAIVFLEMDDEKSLALMKRMVVACRSNLHNKYQNVDFRLDHYITEEKAYAIVKRLESLEYAKDAPPNILSFHLLHKHQWEPFAKSCERWTLIKRSQNEWIDEAYFNTKWSRDDDQNAYTIGMFCYDLSHNNLPIQEEASSDASSSIVT